MRDLKVLIPYLLRRKRDCWIAVLALLLAAVVEPTIPALLKPLVDENFVSGGSSPNHLVIFGLFCAFFAKGLAEYFSNVYGQKVSHYVITEIREHLFAKFVEAPILTLRRMGESALISKITHDTGQLAGAVSTVWITLFKDSLIVLGLVGYMLYVSLLLTLVVVISAPMVVYVINTAAAKLRKSGESLQELNVEFIERLQATFFALNEVKSFQIENQEKKKFSGVINEIRDVTVSSIRLQSLSVPVVQMIGAAAVCIVVYAASLLVQMGALTAGEFVSFIAALAMTFEPIRRLTGVSLSLQRGIIGARSIRDALQIEREDAYRKTLAKSDCPPNVEQLSIELQDVSFKYPASVDHVFDRVSVSIPFGSLVGITGQSGRGKSTLALILSGLLQDFEGVYKINGKSTKEMIDFNIRNLFSYISQTPVLMPVTVAENIALCEESEIDMVRLETVISRVGLSEQLASFGDKDKTQVTFLGSNLSGGQRQRIALARALYRGSPLLVLDEPTSALDADNSMKIRKTLLELKADHTIFVITHDARMYQDFDLIIDLDKASDNN